MNYKYIFFDFDGTVVDTINGTRDSAIYALNKVGIDESNNPDIGRIFSGPPIKESFSKYDLTPEQIDQAANYYREYQANNTIECNTVYEGIPELLKKLNESGKKCYIVTAKLETTARKILEYCGLAQYFEMIVGATPDGSRAKKTEILKYTISTIENYSSDKAIMIGDRPSDIKAGIANGMDTIGVLYGMDVIENLQEAGAKYTVNTPLEMLDSLDRNVLINGHNEER